MRVAPPHDARPAAQRVERRERRRRGRDALVGRDAHQGLLQLASRPLGREAVLETLQSGGP